MENSKKNSGCIAACVRGSASALLTDLYELTMACGYWKTGTHNKDSVFHLFFRNAPFHGGYAIAAGLSEAVAWLRDLRFTENDLDYLAGIPGNDGQPMFERGFIDCLRAFEFTCDVDAVPEGTVVFPNEPLLRVRGPILQAQLVETALLNAINFQTLVATKAARVCQSAQGEPVLEFGLRRAQGVDGALAASRAAYIGGCAATSNVLAGRLFGIPVRGTHAHSWVMAFDTEAQAFQAYAEAMPNNCVFLVDTYDTLEGVRRAAEAGKWLHARGHKLGGIRLDSGDLAYLSIEARKILDEAGLREARIIASNDLDEHIIASLKQQGATISVWGVGTKLVTAYDQPALGGVYKLSAIRATPAHPWEHKIKLSEQALKISNPGIQQVRRFSMQGEFAGDMIYNCETSSGLRQEPATRVIIDQNNAARRKQIPAAAEAQDLLVPVFRGGRVVSGGPESETLGQIRARVADQLARLHPGVKRLLNPHEYPVGLDPALYDLKMRLVMQKRQFAG